ncbi:hypothetical protein Tco_0041410, partial [Tanacetum coccineum]
TEYNIPSPIPLALSRAPPVVEFYYGNIISRRVLTLCISSPIVIVTVIWLLLLGLGAVPTGTTPSN